MFGGPIVRPIVHRASWIIHRTSSSHHDQEVTIIQRTCRVITGTLFLGEVALEVEMDLFW